MKALRFIHPALVAAVLALEATPWSAVCNFAIAPEDGGGVDRQTFSYFDMLPLGYGNAGPFLTAVLSCALLIAAVVACFTQAKGATGAVIWLSVAAAVTSLMPLMFGLPYYSVVGLFITLLLMLSAVLGAVRKRRIG